MPEEPTLFDDAEPLVTAPCAKCGSRKVAADHDDEDCVKERAWRDLCRASWARCSWPSAEELRASVEPGAAPK